MLKFKITILDFSVCLNLFGLLLIWNYAYYYLGKFDK